MMSSPAPIEDQAKLLDEVLNVVRIQAHQMNSCLENNKLMDGLKHCSNMLAELRTSALTPKTYYELYMAVFDALRHLTVYLTEAHQAGRHHLADLYELVQYAGNIVPRLYLMITVGSAYMGMPDAPVAEILRDMMEMTRGVQHPIRGLFLRNYLSSMTRDYLPMENGLEQSIEFILNNFTEMNKLWVRLQYQGHSRDREKREVERQELKILVGTNLVRLSQMDGVDLETYQSVILPEVLSQVVNCRDVIAQEYLMESLIQVFPDEFHLRTLQPFLQATARLEPRVNVKQIIISLIDRLAAYATREAENDDDDDLLPLKSPSPAKQASPEPEEPVDTATEKADDEAADHEPASVPEEETAGTESADNAEDDKDQQPDDQPAQHDADEPTLQSEETEEPTNEKPIRKVRGIPEDVELFVVFWAQIVELVKARPDLGIQDLMALLVSLTNLSLSCYPDRLDYVDQILGYAKDKMAEFSDSPDLHARATESNLLHLLQTPLQHYSSVLTLLALTNYQPLLALQPFNTRRAVAHAVVDNIRRNQTIISTPEHVNGVLDLCDVMLRDQKDAPVAPASVSGSHLRGRNDFYAADQDDMREEQGAIARILHLFQSPDEDTQFLLLSAARKQLGDGGQRIRYTFPPLIIAAIKLARRYKLLPDQNEVWEKKTSTLFRFIHQVISTLNHKCDCADLCLHQFLLAGQCADELSFEEIAYEFFVEAFSIYEDAISDSKAQYQALTCIIGALQQARAFSTENYDTLITKTSLHCARLLKKPDQCRALYLASHLWWQPDNQENPEDKPILKEGKRALERLQKALKIADSCVDAVTNVELFVEILNQYIYYFEKGNEAVTVKYLNGLIDLIHTNLNNLDDPEQYPPTANSSSLVAIEGNPADYVKQHFRATLAQLQERKKNPTSNEWGVDYSEVDLGVF
ncbi:vacuolar protein sorting-associated protein 35 [Hesseltinella vesiculosa]|uniref:Vacuolar protein sorting-associated protein 35 n=1 Tax=Hesseltinella vesiculosa TaxID=101127 RepID=A0A1X2GQD1_9FUNG|nr:vacuolar protein sorting-associated protein 35 [Hesseltinella vesiculosa]